MFQLVKENILIKRKSVPVVILTMFILTSFVQHSSFFNLEIQGVHSWRQSQTMWNVRNFVRHDNNILNPRINTFNGGKDNILRYELPLMQWMIAQVQRVVGEEIRVARILIFLIGLISILAFTLLVHTIFGNWLTAVFSAILLQYSPVFYYYTINPIPDNLALAFSFVYLAAIIKHRYSSKMSYLIIASLSLALASLCKLPFLMVSIVSIWFFIVDLIRKESIPRLLKQFVLPQILFILPAIAWYAWVMPTWKGNPILTGQMNETFILSEYLDIIIYHCSTMFPQILTSFPIWILLILGLYQFFKKFRKVTWLIPLIGITFVYLGLELKPIGTVHDYYMMPFLPWIYLILAFGVSKVLKYTGGLSVILLICIASAIYTPYKFNDYWSIENTYFNNDVINYSEELKNAVPRDERCIILNDHTGYIFSYRIDKQGFVFDSDNLPVEWIEDMIRNFNVSYLYSDSRKVDDSIAFQKYIDKIILQRGSVKVIKLKIPDLD